MNSKMKWLGALFALVLILTALPLSAFAQNGAPGQGNPPPGLAKGKGQEGGNGNDNGQGNGGDNGKAGQGNGQSIETRLINLPASKLIGLPIIDLQGKQIGTAEDLLVDLTGQRQSGDPNKPATGGLVSSGRVNYVLARYGGTLGLGGGTVPVPLATLRLHLVDGNKLGFDDNLVYFQGVEPGDNGIQDRKDFFGQNALVLVSDQMQNLDNAPKFNLDGLRDINDPSWDKNLRAYWQGPLAPLAGAKVENGAAYRVVTVGNLRRFGLRELGGNSIGAIRDALLALTVANPTQTPLPESVISPAAAAVVDANGATATPSRDADRAALAARALRAALPIVDARVYYALVTHGSFYGIGGKTSPVPVPMLMMDRDFNQRNMYVEANNDLLKDSPSIDARQPNELNDENFFNRVRAYWQQAGFGPFER